MKDKLQDQVNVYLDMDSDINIGEGSGNSFKPNSQTKMKYNEFLDKMSTNSVGVTMKDSLANEHPLRKDIA